MSTAVSEWDTPVTKGAGGGEFKYELCPAGNHPATIIGVINVGHHEKVRDDHTTYQQQELVYLLELIEEQSDGSPFIFGLRCARSMNDRSTMYDLATSVLGETFPENAVFDPRRLVGQACQVQIVHKEHTNAKGQKATYANIASKGVKGFPRKMTPPKPVHEWLVWSVNDGTPCPEDKWLPVIYGKTINQIVAESVEAKQKAQQQAEDNIAY